MGREISEAFRSAIVVTAGIRVEPMTELILQRRNEANQTPEIILPGGTVVMMTPSISEDYWAYRVQLSERQAVVGFPKYWTVGIGFALEEDWNTNLPFTCDAPRIFEHIAHNKGDDAISDDDVLAAIRLIQDAVAADRLAPAQVPS